VGCAFPVCVPRGVFVHKLRIRQALSRNHSEGSPDISSHRLTCVQHIIAHMSVLAERLKGQLSVANSFWPGSIVVQDMFTSEDRPALKICDNY
jgi:hypothetical protein